MLAKFRLRCDQVWKSPSYRSREPKVFAEALSRLTGLPSAIMKPTSLMPDVELTGAGIHAVVLHPDGDVEDVWGKQKPDMCARRYAMMTWTLDQEAHAVKVNNALREDPSRKSHIVKAMTLIRRYRRNG